VSTADNAAAIAELQREVSELKATVADLVRRVPPVRVAPAPIAEPATVVTYPQAAVAMPDAKQLGELQRIVLQAHPALGWDTTSPVAVELAWGWSCEFERAMMAVQSFAHTADGQLNTKFYASHWLDQADDLLRSLGQSSVSSKPFIAAALASGVEHNYSNDSANGQVLLLGLSAPGTGRPGRSDGWVETLRTRRIRAKAASPPSPQTQTVPERLRPRITQQTQLPAWARDDAPSGAPPLR